MHFNKKFTRIGVGLALIVGGLTLVFSLFVGQVGQNSQSKALAADNCQYFPETNHQVCGAFLQYWQTHGGLAQQGFPVSDVFAERNQPPPAGDGQLHNVQYFQRARFEEHLESSSNPVQLGLLGSEQYNAKYSGGGSTPTATPPPPSPSTQGLTINSKTTVSQINGVAAASGNVFLIVDVTLTNNSSNAIRSSTDGFALSNGQPLQYFASPQSANLDTPWTSQILFNGQTQRGKVAFEIPASFQPQSLIFTYSDSFKASSNF